MKQEPSGNASDSHGSESITHGSEEGTHGSEAGSQGTHGSEARNQGQGTKRPRTACGNTSAKGQAMVQFEDKTQYNCFHYRLARAPSDLQEKWDVLKLTNTEEAQTFIKDMATVTNGDYDAVNRKSTSVTDEIGTDESEGWISYKKFADAV